MRIPGQNLRYALAIDAASDPASLAAAVRAAVRAVDTDVPVFGVRTLEEIRETSLATDRFLLLLLALFGASAVLLAVVGVYGVTSHDARLRRREIGIRLAVGASQREIQRMVLARGVRLGLTGVAIGAAAALVSARVLRPLLYGVALTDPWSLTAVAAALVAASALACAIPARRAGRLDPVQVLRSE